MTPLALQLWTVRDLMAKDFAGTLRQVAQIGYKGVELAGLANQPPKEYRKMLDDLGLVASSIHTGLPTRADIQQHVDTAGTLGYTLLGVGAIGGPEAFATTDDIQRAAEKLQAAAELLKPYGLRFNFHNHWWEMNDVGGRMVLDQLLELAPDVCPEIDVYWACNFGQVDVPAVIRRYARRTPLLHIKDGPLVKDAPHTAVGQGKMNIAGCIRAADPAVLRWAIVELDQCATDMMTAVRESYAWMTSHGLAEGKK